MQVAVWRPMNAQIKSPGAVSWRDGADGKVKVSDKQQAKFMFF